MSELEVVRRRQIEVSKNKDIVKKKIDDYFNSAISSLDASRNQLLKRVDKKISEDIDLLKDKKDFTKLRTKYARIHGQLSK